ncbi:MAG: MBL fold metallo-hydrolase [Fibrobacterota bacterium]|nr:MAG: MBL fold metallo-hydrolase [Fibrobacterota bacterium]
MLSNMKYSKRIPRIGQGGMIIQEIGLSGRTLRIIYDCGTKSDKSIIKTEIRRLEKSIETILIISHLHDDHINCIDILKLEKINITKVILPNMSEEEIRLCAATLDDPEIAGFVFRPEGYFSEARIIRIENSDESGVENPILSEMSGGEYSHSRNFMALSEARMPSWAIRFYVNKAVYRDLKEAEKLLIGQTSTVEDVQEHKNELIDIYNRISGSNFNSSSMMAFLYPQFDPEYLLYCCCFFDCRCLIMCSGDIKISNTKISDAIANHYEKQQHLITDVMLPHHGGDEYFKISPFPNMIRAYSQTGPSSIHKHPGQKTQMLLDSLNVEFYNITSNGLN